MKNVNIAIAGSWGFHAMEFVERINRRSDCRVTTAWDSDAEQGAAWASQLGLSFQPDYDELLKDPNIDGIILTSATVDHDVMTEKAIRAGKHIIAEKSPMTTMDGARRIQKALEEKKVIYKVSDPITKPSLLYLKKMAEDGLFGELTLVVSRNVHDKGLCNTLPERFFIKEESGGGVLIDIGCHGVHVLSWFLGRPVASAAITSQMLPLAKKHGSEDNAVAAYRFSNGAIGVVETAWLGDKQQEAFHIYGTNGCAHVIGSQNIHYCLRGEEWKTVPKEMLPSVLPKPMDLWLDSLINDVDHPEYGIEEAVSITEMVTSAYRYAGLTEDLWK